MRMESFAASVLHTATILAALVAAPWASAQSPPRLALQFSGGHAVVSLTGDVGGDCTIQYTDSLTQTNNWQFLTNLTPLSSSPYLVTDPNISTASRFYRAISQQVPTNVVTTNMVWIPPGSFTMGSPTNEALREPYGTDETQHIVTISRGFWMGKYLVTQEDYLSMVGTNPSRFSSANGFSDDPTRPVEQVTWNDAANYCALRTQQEVSAGLIPPDYAYRLPTESEWEYADRSGTTTALYLGRGLHSRQANFDGREEYDASAGDSNNFGGLFLGITTSVGSYPPNAWGLYDMIGNVGEWCQDWYGDYPNDAVTDPQGAASGTKRLVRGGGWLSYGHDCRSARRVGIDPVWADIAVGFRVVLAPSQP